LSALRSEIRELSIGDEDARRRLDSLVLDIESRISHPGGEAAGETLSGRLKASILSFEASHPRLAGVMNDVLDKLSAMGI
jgi:hypothetical protein